MKNRKPSENQAKVLRLQGLAASSIIDGILDGEDGNRVKLKDLLARMRVSKLTLYNIRKGRRAAGRQTICKLAKHMNLVQTRVWLELLALYDDDMSVTPVLAERLRNAFYLSAGDVQWALSEQ